MPQLWLLYLADVERKKLTSNNVHWFPREDLKLQAQTHLERIYLLLYIIH